MKSMGYSFHINFATAIAGAKSMEAQFKKLESSVQSLATKGKGHLANFGAQFDGLGTKIGTMFKNMDAHLTKAASSLKSFGMKMSMVGIGMMLTGEQMIKRFISKPMELFGQFEQKMIDLQFATGANTAEMKKWYDYAIKVSLKSLFTPKEVADAMYTVASAGITGEKNIKAATEAIVDATVALHAPMEQVAQGAIATTKAFGNEISDLEHGIKHTTDVWALMARYSMLRPEEMSDVFVRTAASAKLVNQSLETTAVMLMAVRDKGITAAESTEYVNNAMLQMVQYQTMRRVQGTLGVQVVDQETKGYRNMLDIYKDIRDKFKEFDPAKAGHRSVYDMLLILRKATGAGAATTKQLDDMKTSLGLTGDETKDYTIILKAAQSRILGNSTAYKALNAAIDYKNEIEIAGTKVTLTSIEGLQQMEWEMQHAGGQMHEYADMQKQSWEGIKKLWHSSIEALQTVVGSLLTPIIGPVVKSITGMLNKLVEFFQTDKGAAFVKGAAMIAGIVGAIVLLGGAAVLAAGAIASLTGVIIGFIAAPLTLVPVIVGIGAAIGLINLAVNQGALQKIGGYFREISQAAAGITDKVRSVWDIIFADPTKQKTKITGMKEEQRVMKERIKLYEGYAALPQEEKDKAPEFYADKAKELKKFYEKDKFYTKELTRSQKTLGTTEGLGPEATFADKVKLAWKTIGPEIKKAQPVIVKAVLGIVGEVLAAIGKGIGTAVKYAIGAVIAAIVGAFKAVLSHIPIIGSLFGPKDAAAAETAGNTLGGALTKGLKGMWAGLGTTGQLVIGVLGVLFGLKTLGKLPVLGKVLSGLPVVGGLVGKKSVASKGASAAAQGAEGGAVVGGASWLAGIFGAPAAMSGAQAGIASFLATIAPAAGVVLSVVAPLAILAAGALITWKCFSDAAKADREWNIEIVRAKKELPAYNALIKKTNEQLPGTVAYEKAQDKQVKTATKLAKSTFGLGKTYDIQGRILTVNTQFIKEAGTAMEKKTLKDIKAKEAANKWGGALGEGIEGLRQSRISLDEAGRANTRFQTKILQGTATGKDLTKTAKENAAALNEAKKAWEDWTAAVTETLSNIEVFGLRAVTPEVIASIGQSLNSGEAAVKKSGLVMFGSLFEAAEKAHPLIADEMQGIQESITQKLVELKPGEITAEKINKIWQEALPNASPPCQAAMMELITKINGNITGWDAKGETNKKTTDIKNEFNPDGSAKPVVDEFGFLIAALTGQWDRWNPKKQILSWTTGLFGFETPSPEEPPPPEKKKDSKMGVTTGSITEGMVASTADNAWAKPQTMATQFAKNAAVGQTKAYNTALAGGAPAVQGAAQKTFANPMILTFQDVYSMCVSLGAATGGKTADAVLRGINIALPGITGFRAQVKGAQGDYDKLKASGWSSGMGTGIGPWTGAMGGSKGAMAAAADRSRLGRPYIRGGGSPPNSFDCSSLTQWAWRQAGVGIPRTSETQSLASRLMPTAGAPIGSLVFRKGSEGAGNFPGGYGHVGMITGPGGEVTHAAGTKYGVIRGNASGFHMAGWPVGAEAGGFHASGGLVMMHPGEVTVTAPEVKAVKQAINRGTTNNMGGINIYVSVANADEDSARALAMTVADELERRQGGMKNRRYESAYD